MKKLVKISLVCLSLTLSVLHSCKQINLKQENSGQFVNFTDLHFNPFFDTTIVTKLENEETEHWDSLLKSNSDKSLGEYGDESNYFLWNKTLREMKRNMAEPDFIIMTGDYICHDFGKNYRKYTHNNNFEDMHVFLLKTVTYVTKSIQETFPNTLIIPTFGNNDSYCGDYHLQNDKAFLHDFSRLYLPTLGDYLTDEEIKNLKQHGYYCLQNPYNKSHKIISMNSIYFSYKYQSNSHSWNCDCESGLTNQDSIAQQQFIWLENQLEKSKINNEKVWIITHIPPGVNVFKVLENKNENKAFLYWEKSYNEKYLSLLEKYSSIVFTTMTGHTHMDDFKLHIKDSSKTYIHISPSISPVFGNNPAFQVVKYDRTGAIFSDFTTYYINIAENKTVEWEKAYTFTEIYPVRTLDAWGYDSLLTFLNNDSTFRIVYGKNYESGRTNGIEIANEDWKWYYCGISSTLSFDYENCVLKK